MSIPEDSPNYDEEWPASRENTSSAIFPPQNAGGLAQQRASFQAFVRNYKPSQGYRIKIRGVTSVWLATESRWANSHIPEAPSAEVELIATPAMSAAPTPEVKERLTGQWAKVLATAERGTWEDLWALGKAAGLGIGKWVVVLRREQVDDVWARVAAATDQGLLGTSAQVQTYGASHDNHHELWVYAGPYWDEHEVTRVLKGLREHCSISPRLLRYYADFSTLINGVGRVPLYESRLALTSITKFMSLLSGSQTAGPRPGETNEELCVRRRPKEHGRLVLSDRLKDEQLAVLYQDLVDRGEIEMSPVTHGPEAVREAITAEWYRITSGYSSPPTDEASWQPLKQAVLNAARRFGWGSSKWVIRVDSPSDMLDVQVVGVEVARAMDAHMLGSEAEVCVSEDGRQWGVAVSVDPWWDQQGEVERVLGVLRDIPGLEKVRMDLEVDVVTALGLADGTAQGLRTAVYEALGGERVALKVEAVVKREKEARRMGSECTEEALEERREGENVEAFVRRLRPSQSPGCSLAITCQERVDAVKKQSGTNRSRLVRSPVRDERENQHLLQLLDEWERLEAAGQATLAQLWVLCKRHNKHGGYWRAAVAPSMIDEVWSAVARATDDGQLGTVSRVLPAGYDSEAKTRVHTVVVHLEPFWDLGEVERVLTGLRDLCGVNAALVFEADVVPKVEPGGGRTLQFYEAERGMRSATCLVSGLIDARLPGEPFKDFMDRAQPSKGDHVTHWISLEHMGKLQHVMGYYVAAVETGRMPLSGYTHGHAEVLSRCRAEWDELVAAGTASLEQLWLLGRRSGYGGGSWVMQVLPSELDDMWHKVASKTETGLLGVGAQVRPLDRGIKDLAPREICIRVDPYWDKSEVERVFQTIRRQLLETRPLVFVADLVADLGLDAERMGDARGLAFFEAAEGSDVILRRLHGVTEYRAVGETVEDFLGRLRPQEGDGTIMWYCIKNKERLDALHSYYYGLLQQGQIPCSHVTHGQDYVMSQIRAEWDAHISSGGDPSPQALAALGQRLGFGAGRWVMVVNGQNVDAVWAVTAHATAQGKLGFQSQLAPAHSRFARTTTSDYTNEYTIAVFVDPFWDKDEVDRVLQAIRDEGINVPMRFLADMVTCLGVKSYFYTAPAYATVSLGSAAIAPFSPNGAQAMTFIDNTFFRDAALSPVLGTSPYAFDLASGYSTGTWPTAATTGSLMAYAPTTFAPVPPTYFIPVSPTYAGGGIAHHAAAMISPHHGMEVGTFMAMPVPVLLSPPTVHYNHTRQRMRAEHQAFSFDGSP